MKSGQRLLLYLVFFVSGGAALVYETLWFRQASLIFGNSVWAGSTVLAAFMAGIAIGNAVVARAGHRSRNPIRLYGVLELGIAGAGLTLVLVFPHLNASLAPVFGALRDSPLLLNATRLTIGFVLMLFPTAAMGATLPVMVHGVRTADSRFGERLGRLYACNTIGAMTGALACELFLIEHFGIPGAGIAAAAANVLAAVVAISVNLHQPALPIAAQQLPADSMPALSRRARTLLAAAALCGGTLLALEVVWFRFLMLFNFGTSRTFAYMLAVVLAGIALGGLCGAVWVKRSRRSLSTGMTLSSLAAGLMTVVSFAGPTLLMIFEPVRPDIDLTGRATLLHAIPVMMPVSVLSGFLFTLIGEALHRECGSDTRSAGYLTLSNTSGALVGAWAGGFLLLPILGIQWSFAVLALSYGSIALICHRATRDVTEIRVADKPRRLVTGSGCLLAVSVVALAPPFLSTSLFLKVAERYCDQNTRVTALREGLTETVMYATTESLGHPLFHRLITNCHSMSGTNPACLQYMKLYVYLPVAVHPQPRKACLISYGCGVTAKALTDTSELEQIDVVDISRDILELNHVVYPDPGECPLDDRRVRTIIEDGRFHLQTTDERYDLITSEPPPPRGAGVVNLYTREYFQLIHDRLAAGGMVTYWLPHQSLGQQDARGIIRAFCEVFEDSSLWLGAGPNWMLFGVRDGHHRVSEQRFRQQWHDKRVARSLAECGIESPEQLGSWFVADRPVLMALTADTPPLVDSYPYRLQPVADGIDVESRYRDLLDPDKARQRFLASPHVHDLWPDSLVAESVPCFQQRCLIHDLWCISRYRWYEEQGRSLRQLHRLLTTSSLRTSVLWCLGSSSRDQAIVDLVRDQRSDSLPVILKLAFRAVADRDYPLAVTHYRAFLRTAGKHRGSTVYQSAVLQCALLKCLAGRSGDAQLVMSLLH